MKNTIMICCSLFFFGMATSSLKAQTQLEKNKYAVLSKKIQQLPAILQTATALENEDSELFGEFQVIFCGKTLQNIPQNQEFIALLKTAKKQGVKIFACGISLTKFNLSKKDVPSGLPITENGILHAFQLQKQGFLTLSI
ncbi:DsrE family protein [Mesonia mobilis]|uniref:DsrE family protein n=1 Tax=Mesonia mobilis TaxID=369791 RepID=UPI0026EDFEE8|nr:DsrE family protein [Mesonia mobilis]